MRRIIMDVDTGHDDAMAIALAAGLKDQIRLEALIATYGNVSGDKTLNNTLNMAEALELDCPVFHGSYEPLVRARVDAGKVHGESGFDGPVFPKRVKQECKGNGITWAIDYVKKNPGEITFVSVGPLTDLALCIKTDKEFKDALKEVVIMGGAVEEVGNVTETAEFNIYADPDAASIVFSSGVPITFFPLDVTYQIRLSEEAYERMKEMKDSNYKRILLESMDYYIPSCKMHGNEGEGFPAMHDPCTIAYLADESIFTFTRRPIFVNTTPGTSYGKTTGGFVKMSSNTKMGVKANSKKFWSLFFKAIKTLP